MIALFQLLGGFRGLIVGAGFAVAAWVAFQAYDAVIDDPRQKAAGASQERILWEEARRRMLAQQEAARKAAQAEIDAAEAEYLTQQKRADEAEAALEEAIHENETAGTDDGIGLPGRLSAPLDAVGR